MDCIKIGIIPRVQVTVGDGKPKICKLSITAHHLLLCEHQSGNDQWIPLPLVYHVTRSRPDFSGSNHPLILRTRDFKVYTFVFFSGEEADGVFDSLKALTGPGGYHAQGIEGLYAFAYEGETGDEEIRRRAWSIYTPTKEFERMGITSRTHSWRTTNINSDFQFCPSYPSTIVVPARISDSTLKYAVKYRSKGRIPGLVYIHWANLGSITRSSQPMVGLKNARSPQDEKLVSLIFLSHSQHTNASREQFALASGENYDPNTPTTTVYGAHATNLIIDARPTTNAMANSVKGAGTENMDYYKGCKKAYLGIDNIHVMRASISGIYEALRESEVTGHLDRIALRKTNWLKHLTNILEGVVLITRTIHLSNSHVLVHCSDGWDRTSQLTSLSELCLDPYYRTAEGFAVLIEKDWMSYGHRFSDRSGHLCGDRTEFVSEFQDGVTSQQTFFSTVQKQFASSSHAFKETCPVFSQFLDCVYQIMRQYPERFEFNQGVLHRLVWETYSQQSGSFLFNSERDRAMYNAAGRTHSVWESIFDFSDAAKLSLKAEYRNGLYDVSRDDPTSRDRGVDLGVLFVDAQDVKFWFELFGKGDEEMNGKPEIEVVELESESNSPITMVTSTMDEITAQASNIELSQDASRSTVADAPSSPPRSNQFSYSQAQFATAVSSVQKLGWGAWKAAQSKYQEAVEQYREANDTPLASTPDSTRAPSAAHYKQPSANPWMTSEASELAGSTVSSAGSSIYVVEAVSSPNSPRMPGMADANQGWTTDPRKNVESGNPWDKPMKGSAAVAGNPWAGEDDPLGVGS